MSVYQLIFSKEIFREVVSSQTLSSPTVKMSDIGFNECVSIPTTILSDNESKKNITKYESPKRHIFYKQPRLRLKRLQTTNEPIFLYYISISFLKII